MILVETPAQCLARLRPHLDRAAVLTNPDDRGAALAVVINAVQIHLHYNRNIAAGDRDALLALQAVAVGRKALLFPPEQVV